LTAVYLARSRNHLCNLARRCLQRGVDPVWVVRRYAHVMDKQCLGAVIDKANTVDIRDVASLVNGVIPYVPRKWLYSIDPRRAIRTVARFVLPLKYIIRGIFVDIDPNMYIPLLANSRVGVNEYIYKHTPAVSVAAAAQYSYKYLRDGRPLGSICELKDLIGMIGRGSTKNMMIHTLKLWNERKQAFNIDDFAAYEAMKFRYLQHCYDFISGGAVFSLPIKHAIAAMDFIMTDCLGRGICVPEFVIRHLLYKSPCLHYKVWDFVINRILDARNYIDADAWLAGLVHNILRRGCLYARLPQSTLHRIVIQFPMAVSPKIFGPRDVAVAKLAMIGGSD